MTSSGKGGLCAGILFAYEVMTCNFKISFDMRTAKNESQRLIPPEKGGTLKHLQPGGLPARRETGPQRALTKPTETTIP